MTPEILSILTVFGAGILSAILTYFTAMYVNKKKVPAEVDKIKADTGLTGGELIRKYQEIAEKQADENLSLQSQIKEKEEEKKSLAKAIEEVRQEMRTMKEQNDREISEINKKLEEAKAENLSWRSWAERLVLQLESWAIKPVPFDVNGAKAEIRKSCIE